MQLAEVISRGLYHSIIKTIGGKKSNSILQNKLNENIEA
jgi:hypothetical protein